QDGAKAHSLVKLKLQSSQATLSYRVAVYFLKTLQIIESGFVDAFVVSLPRCKKNLDSNFYFYTHNWLENQTTLLSLYPNYSINDKNELPMK
ncbi:MAG: hypothetical protein IKK87_04100, partial [Bacteroidaceae bacterium]|nr:hypothetical protein [Bacteroidaceae bacterium]